jgi:predicted porin
MSHSRYRSISIASLLALTLVCTAVAQNKPPTNAELWAIIQKQAKEIETLKQQVASMRQDVDATGDAVAEISVGSGVGAGWSANTHVGGYGEVHMNKLHDSHGTSNKDEIDYHRFVLFVNHDFSDRLRLVTEIELEHSLAGEGKDGEVELEQAYVEYDLTEEHALKAGMFLVPVGLLNETHEPPTFYGVERNPVEKNILPTTWWESGLGLSGRFGDGVRYDLAYTSGLEVPVAGKNAFKVRSGRQKTSEAAANDGAVTARLRYVAPGLEVGASVQHQEDLTQGADEASGQLYSGHLDLQRGMFRLRALYALWDIDSAAFRGAGADQQEGWYIEPSLRLNEQFGIFVRYNRWDNKAGDSVSSDITQVDVGVNYWLHENVVFKLDYQDQTAPSGTTELDGFNFGVGFQF